MGTLAFGNSNQMLCPNILYFKFLFNDTKFWKVFWSCQVWNSWNMLHLAIMIKEQSIQYLQSPCLFDHTFPHTPTIPWGAFKQTYENLKVAQTKGDFFENEEWLQSDWMYYSLPSVVQKYSFQTPTIPPGRPHCYNCGYAQWGKANLKTHSGEK